MKRALLLFLLLLVACGGEPSGETVEITVPRGASFHHVTDSLVEHDLVRAPILFRALARVRGDDRRVRSGRYAIPAEAGWFEILDQMVAGRMISEAMTIPEGWTLQQIAVRLAQVTEMEDAEVHAALQGWDLEAEERWDLPGPGLEGYLFPDTYQFAPGTPLDSVVRVMIDRYRSVWTPERRARLEALGWSEGELMTLASIVQAEARRTEEMPIIAAVFHNRLRIGYLLQADPTVQYALGERRSRLLYADIDSVADHPYNTYTQPGLPPGPIGAPGEDAVEAALFPADVDYLYFVARPDGSHIFTRTLDEHNRARVQARREWDRLPDALSRDQ